MTNLNRLRIPTPDEVRQLGPDDRAALAEAAMGGLEPGFQKLGVFNELSRLTVLSTVEVVPLRTNPETKATEALLLQRPSTDKWWADQWHVPGTVILPTDKVANDADIDVDGPDFDPIDSYLAPIRRISEKELKGAVNIIDGPHFVESRFRIGARGHENTSMLYAEVATKSDTPLPPNARFFDVHNLAANPPEGGLIGGHAGLVRRASAKYNERRAIVPEQRRIF